jgi:hypothetical protein
VAGFINDGAFDTPTEALGGGGFVNRGPPRAMEYVPEASVVEPPRDRFVDNEPVAPRDRFVDNPVGTEQLPPQPERADQGVDPILGFYPGTKTPMTATQAAVLRWVGPPDPTRDFAPAWPISYPKGAQPDADGVIPGAEWDPQGGVPGMVGDFIGRGIEGVGRLYRATESASRGGAFDPQDVAAGMGVLYSGTPFARGAGVLAAGPAGRALVRGLEPLAEEVVAPGMQGLVREGVGPLVVDPLAGPRISTRVPYDVAAKKKPELVHGTDLNTVGLDSSVASGPAFAKNAELIRREYPELKLPADATDHEVVNAFIDHVKDNLVWLHDNMDPAARERAKLWYEGANRIANAWAAHYGLEPHQAAGALAALSPQKDWFQNVSLAGRLLDVVKNQGDTVFSPQMMEWAKGYVAQVAKSNPEQAAALVDTFNAMRGRAFREINDPDSRAIWARAYDEAHNDRGYNLITPEGQVGEPVLTNAGVPQKVGWGSFAEISKAMQAAEATDPSRTSVLMGGQAQGAQFLQQHLRPAVAEQRRHHRHPRRRRGPVATARRWRPGGEPGARTGRWRIQQCGDRLAGALWAVCRGLPPGGRGAGAAGA